MAESNRILVVVDPSKGEDQVALTRAEWLAVKLGLGLELLICYYQQSLTGEHFFDTPRLESLRKEVIARYYEKLEKIARTIRRKGIDVTVSATWDMPLDEGIIRQVLKNDPAYVVKETHFHRPIQRAVFTNTDWNLVRLCPAPLWLAKADDWPDDPTILASLDPTHENDEYSELDQQILGHATRIAEKTDCPVHAFNAYMPIASIPPIQASSQSATDDSLAMELEENHRMRMNLQLETVDIPEENVHLAQGYPEELLPELAEELQAGLVVMGSIARNALQRVFIGSTTEKVLDKLPCDLLVVKPEWFVTPVAEA